MKCPLLTAGMFADPTVKGDVWVECSKEECAWYRQQAEHCVLFILAEDVRDLRDTMRAIEDKMPYEKKGTD